MFYIFENACFRNVLLHSKFSCLKVFAGSRSAIDKMLQLYS